MIAIWIGIAPQKCVPLNVRSCGAVGPLEGPDEAPVVGAISPIGGTDFFAFLGGGILYRPVHETPVYVRLSQVTADGSCL